MDIFAYFGRIMGLLDIGLYYIAGIRIAWGYITIGILIDTSSVLEIMLIKDGKAGIFAKTDYIHLCFLKERIATAEILSFIRKGDGVVDHRYLHPFCWALERISFVRTCLARRQNHLEFLCFFFQKKSMERMERTQKEKDLKAIWNILLVFVALYIVLFAPMINRNVAFAYFNFNKETRDYKGKIWNFKEYTSWIKLWNDGSFLLVGSLWMEITSWFRLEKMRRFFKRIVCVLIVSGAKLEDSY